MIEKLLTNEAALTPPIPQAKFTTDTSPGDLDLLLLEMAARGFPPSAGWCLISALPEGQETIVEVARA